MEIRWASAGAVGHESRTLGERLGLGGRTAKCVFVYVSPTADLDRLGTELAALEVPVIACTTAGQIGREGFEHGDLTAAAVFDGLSVSSYAIPSLVDLEASVDRAAGALIASGILERSDVSTFGVVLVDGLSRAEERLMHALHLRLPRLSIVGGSAGDELAFQQTHVFFDGKFRQGGAVLHVFSTPCKVAPIKLQHHVPTEHRLVITRATPANRMVHEINGLPAVEAYARAVGVEPEALDNSHTAAHPLMLKIGNEHFVRSIRLRQDDGSLELFSAIEQGLVVRLGTSAGLVETLEAAFARASREVGGPALVLGYDCILRRTEIERRNLGGQIGSLFVEHNVIGFSTYGEQFNALHANQTFTGIMIGRA